MYSGYNYQKLHSCLIKYAYNGLLSRELYYLTKNYFNNSGDINFKYLIVSWIISITTFPQKTLRTPEGSLCVMEAQINSVFSIRTWIWEKKADEVDGF